MLPCSVAVDITHMAENRSWGLTIADPIKVYRQKTVFAASLESWSGLISPAMAERNERLMNLAIFVS